MLLVFLLGFVAGLTTLVYRHRGLITLVWLGFMFTFILSAEILFPIIGGSLSVYNPDYKNPERLFAATILFSGSMFLATGSCFIWRGIFALLKW